MTEEAPLRRWRLRRRHEPIAIDDGRAVTHGRTRFFDAANGDTTIEYDTLWVLGSDRDRRWNEFHEWYSPRADERRDPLSSAERSPPASGHRFASVSP